MKKSINVQIDYDLFNKLEAYRKKYRIKRSDFVVIAIKNEFERRERKFR